MKRRRFLGTGAAAVALLRAPGAAGGTEQPGRNLDASRMRTLGVVQEHLLPSEPGAPGASDVHATYGGNPNGVGWALLEYDPGRPRPTSANRVGGPEPSGSADAAAADGRAAPDRQPGERPRPATGPYRERN